MQPVTRNFGTAAALLALVAGSAWGLNPEEKCEADKNKIAGKYAFCRQRAEAKAIMKGAPPDYSKCDERLLAKWGRAEQKAIAKGTACVDSVTATAIQSFVTASAGTIAGALGGSVLPYCNDGSINVAGEHCDGTDLGGTTCAALGFVGGTLACDLGCAFDTTGCTDGTSGGFPASGQTTAYGAHSDGAVRAGEELSYTDNGDGTITDNNTGLMWEKKSDDGTIHDKDNTYSWCADVFPQDFVCDNFTNAMDGTIVTTFLASLNSGGGFAGYNDWRIPNVKELQSIVNYENVPSVSSAFNTGCVASCTVTSCSCSSPGISWSSTTVPLAPDHAFGLSGAFVKGTSFSVRAVRGS